MKMELIERLRQGLEITEDPYGDLARELGIKKEEVIKEIERLIDEKMILGLKVLVDQNLLGYKVNALIAMRMEDCDCEIFIKNQYISHFYKRRPDKDFPYNYYAMLHCPDENCIKEFSLELEKRNIPHVIMRTIRDLKGEGNNVHSHHDRKR
jgi:DNA-binding Lrp family transcriptional regulator